MSNSSERHIPAAAVRLAGFSLLEPDTLLQRFQPTWFNVWEAAQYKKANARAGSGQWLLRRFGIDDAIQPAEALRKANYRDWLNGLGDACHQAVAQLGAKGEFQLRHERNALLYVDSWGETTTFEEVNSWRDALSVDILPKNIVRDYGINGFSGKLRGERNGLMSALLIAQDMLNSDLSDNVIICGHFRSIPVLVFSEMQRYARPRGGAQGNSQASVERVGCLILKKTAPGGPWLHLSRYLRLPGAAGQAARCLADGWLQHCGANTRQVLGVTPPAGALRQLQQRAFECLPATLGHQALNELYGDSGCMNPALFWRYLQQFPSSPGHTLLSVLDGQGGAWLLENWLTEAMP
ncbi:TPA: ATP-binding protein [Serratia rubidaea]|nr:ATP-binding protein [Serratia rubidaea]HDJ1446968.1 ATP-binding protein [Serratia rubidaea]HDJ1463976.1 ATP-binding protein [Serratia rubidaea]HDJ2773931.1 ATP-binding protein [Serratia rubidaea]